jgi:hypothetical protein
MILRNYSYCQASFVNSVADLIALARETSSERRRELLRQITDMFLSTDVATQTASDLFEEVVLRLARDIGIAGCMALAERIADHASAPRKLVMTLATDEIAVAHPILERSPVLEEDDLVSLATSLSDAHLQSLSLRRSLSEAITDILIQRGSRNVARALAGNEGARFSDGGFGNLVARARGDEVLQEGLASRGDLTEDRVSDLLPLLSERIKKVLSERGITDPDALSAAMLRRLRPHVAAALKERQREDREVKATLLEIREGHKTAEDVIVHLANADRAYDLAAVIGDLTNVDGPTVMKALTGANDEPILVLCRILDLSWPGFEAVLQLRAKRQRKFYVKRQALVRTYSEMDQATAKRIVRFLQVRRAAEQYDDR